MDPFAVSLTPQTDTGQGFAGVSPDTWRNLMMMGANLSTAANARDGRGFLTYGNGLAGPLGAGIQGTMESAQKQAQLRSQLQYQQQQIHSSQLQNRMTELQIPLLQQKLDFTRNLFGPDAPTAPALPSGDAPPAAAAAPVAAPRPTAALDSDGLPPTPELATIATPGGAKFQVATPHADRFQGLVNDLEAAGYKVDPNQSGGYNRRVIAGTNTPSQHAHGSAIDVNWTNNARGGQGDIPPELARALAAKHGLVWGGDWSGNTRDPMHFEVAGTAAPVRLAANIPPGTASDGGAPADATSGSIAARAPLPEIPGPDPALLSRAAALFQKAKMATAAGYPPEAWLAQARQLQEMAWAKAKAASTAAGALPFNVREKLESAGFRQLDDGSIEPIPGGAADPKYIGAAQGAKEANSNVPMRAGSVNRVIGPDGTPTYVAVPERRTRLNDKGQTEEYWATPPVPGAPLPTESTVTGQDPRRQQVQMDALKNFQGEHSVKAFEGAQNGLASMEFIRSGLDTLGPTGFLSTGSGADVRNELARRINTAAGIAGLEPLFDPGKVAAWEDIKKESTRMGMTALSALFGGNREAASIVQTSISSVPTAANSYEGAKLLVAAYENGFQRVIDERNFIASKLQSGNYDLSTAKEEFNQQFPAKQYAMRAISAAKPYPVTSEEDALKRFMPGTIVKVGTLPNGRDDLKIVPGRASVPLAVTTP